MDGKLVSIEKSLILIHEPFYPQLRPCSSYKAEYKECKSIRGRFQQYFVYGEYLDCQHWADDYNNCQKLEWFQDTEAGLAVLKSEMERRDTRIKANFANDVWTKRSAPPANWAAPLPDFMIERNKNTYLEVRAKEIAEDEKNAQEKAERLRNGEEISERTSNSLLSSVKGFFGF